MTVIDLDAYRTRRQGPRFDPDPPAGPAVPVPTRRARPRGSQGGALRRHRRHTTRGTLSARSGVPVEVLRRVEAGEGTLGPSAARRVAWALGISPQVLGIAPRGRRRAA